MREIKFRAFIKEFSQMTNVEYLHIATEEVEVCLSRGGFGTKIFSYSDGLTGAVIMQYTGLKDKNGVEIYEGDIVNYGAVDLSKVEYSHGAFWARTGQYSLLSASHDIEVVGNIYENPNLLEGESK